MKNDNLTKKKSKNKKILIFIIILFCILIGIIASYNVNEDIRNYIDYNILNKEIVEENTAQIDLENENNSYIYAYDNYVIVLNSNILRAYNSNGKEEFNTNITITNPIFDTNQKYLAIAEKNGKKIYVLSGKNIIWQKDIEGEITRVNINKNGYVSVVVSQSTYKTVVITFNSKGNELFKSYLSDYYAIDTTISNDNKYLAIAAINSNGTQIKSLIRIYSIEKIENGKEDSIIY